MCPITLLQCAFVQVGAFWPNDEEVAGMLRQNQPSLPCLFMCGAADAFVPPSRTQELISAAFSLDHVQMIEHPGGHCVPSCTGIFKQTLHGFVDKHSRLRQ